MTAQEIFSYRLYNIRRIRERSRKDVSTGTGFDENTIFYWEKRFRYQPHTPFKVIIDNLAEYFDVPTSYFSECRYTEKVGELLLNPYLDYWVWSGAITYEKAKELQEILPSTLKN